MIQFLTFRLCVTCMDYKSLGYKFRTKQGCIYIRGNKIINQRTRRGYRFRCHRTPIAFTLVPAAFETVYVLCDDGQNYRIIFEDDETGRITSDRAYPEFEGIKPYLIGQPYHQDKPTSCYDS
jgi:hypothetical protein